jgi:hypothetical protein
MKEFRSASQILFGFLPEQTVDLKGMVWKVKEWVEPYGRSIEQESLRQELVRAAAPWDIAGKDGKYVDNLRQGYAVRVLALNKELGVKVEKFPRLWVCKGCDRLYQGNEPSRCICNSLRFGQLPFVGYHDECGGIRSPYITSCSTHKQVKIIFPGTARAEEIRFVCPVCSKVLQKGFGFPRCECGKGSWIFNVHRSASVFTPRTIVMINPPSLEKVAKIREAGGAVRALSWVVGGLRASSFEQTATTAESFKATLLRQGLPESLADQMVDQAIASGVISKVEGPPMNLQGEYLTEAQAGAVNIALALSDSRVRIADLAKSTDANSDLGRKYRSAYPNASRMVGIEDIDLIDSFPVLTGCYGYTRGDSDPGASRLVPYKNRKGDYVVYGEVIQTEALLVRLDPCRVAEWLLRNGCVIPSWTDARSARVSILKSALVPKPGSVTIPPTAGSQLLTLVHSYAHWFTRQLAVRAGIERSSLSEFLVPQHTSFFVYAATRGDFVLGGLQAVFETELDSFLSELGSSDLRCPLDPGCLRNCGACMACLHLGEPSCRYYNAYLSRKSLVGPAGFLSVVAAARRLEDAGAGFKVTAGSLDVS